MLSGADAHPYGCPPVWEAKHAYARMSAYAHSYESLYMFAWLQVFSSGWALHADRLR